MQMNIHRRARIALALTLVGGAALLAACGGDDEAADTAAPAATSEAAAPATSEAAPATSEAAPATSEAAPATSEAAPATSEAAPETTEAAAETTERAEGVVDFEVVEPGSGAGLKLGYISLGDSVPFVKLVSDSIKKQAEIAGAELVFCDSEVDGQKALNCAKSFKTQGVQAYLNFQVDQKLAGAICAAGPDVPVIAIDIVQEPCQVSFMGAANEYAGMVSGAAMGKYAKDNWNCEYDAYVSLESTAAADANRLRMGGNRKGFEQYCPIVNEKILDADRTDPARTKFADTLTSLPDKKRIIVVAINDDGIVGALAAAKTAGREADIFVAGQGADPTSWCGIQNNPNWIGDAAYFPEKYGEIAVPWLIRAAKGETIPEQLLVPHVLVDKNNILDFYTPTDC